MEYDVQRDRYNRWSVNGKEARFWLQCTRTLYRINSSLILKVDNGLYSRQTEREVSVWNSLTEADRKYFQPLLAYGEDWVLQPWLRLKKEVTADELKQAQATIQYMMWRYRLTDVNVFDVEDGNWAIRYDGVPVIYDWGY